MGATSTAHARAKLQQQQSEQPEVFSEAEAWALFDAAAHRFMGMSGSDFLAAWEAGRFHDPEDQLRAMRVTPLIPRAKRTCPVRLPTKLFANTSILSNNRSVVLPNKC